MPHLPLLTNDCALDASVAERNGHSDLKSEVKSLLFGGGFTFPESSLTGMCVSDFAKPFQDAIDYGTPSSPTQDLVTPIDLAFSCFRVIDVL